MWASREADAFHILIFLARPDWRIKKKKKKVTQEAAAAAHKHILVCREVQLESWCMQNKMSRQLRSPSTGASNARHLKLQKIPQLPFSDLTCAKWLPIVPHRHLTSLGRGHRLRTVQKVSLLERCKRFFSALGLPEKLPLQNLKGLRGSWSLYVDRKSC